MNKTVGTCLAMSVAAIFAAACDKSGDAAPTRGSGEPGKDQKEGSNGELKAASAQDPGGSDKAMPSDQKPAVGDVNCLGIHECKGKSACHVIGSHACAGQNACKGKGWITVPAAECQAKGGKVLDT